MLREYQSEIEKLKQMIEKGGFEGGEVVPSEVFQINMIVVLECKKPTFIIRSFWKLKGSV